MGDVTWSGGVAHWTHKGDIRLFLWEKKASSKVPHAGTVFFVHGSSMASQPTFDLHVPGRPYSSAMDWFADHGFDTWTMDNEGYGRSDKKRNINFDIRNGADDLAAGSAYILEKTGAPSLLVYGISSGALKAAMFTELFPQRVAKLALDAFVWTGVGSHTLEQRKKKLPEFLPRPTPKRPCSTLVWKSHPRPLKQWRTTWCQSWSAGAKWSRRLASRSNKNDVEHL